MLSTYASRSARAGSVDLLHPTTTQLFTLLTSLYFATAYAFTTSHPMEPDTSLCPDPESQSTSDSQTLGSFNQSLGTLRTGMASAELVMKDLRERISSMQRAADKLYPENHHVNLPPTHLTRKSRHGPSPAKDGINAGFFSRRNRPKSPRA